MISKNALRKRRYNFWAVATSALVVLSVLVTAASIGAAAGKPKTVAELALYKGADRQQILEEGARKEGTVTFYTTGILTQAVRSVLEAFNKKYPFIKVQTWRGGADALLPKILEEYKSGHHLVDIIEADELKMLILQKAEIIQPFYFSDIASFHKDAITKAPGEGVFRVTFRESGVSLGYNTKLLTKKEVPQTYQDLLDPKWKGKIPVSGSAAGTNWLGCMLVTYGEDFVRRMAKQDFAVQVITARGILDMIISGEYTFSPTIYDSHVGESQKMGAPVDWMPLEPVPILLGQIALPKHSIHPYAALLLAEFELSKESAEIHKAKGYVSPRNDVPGETTYKKFYGAKSFEEDIKWRELFGSLFTKR